MRLKYFLTSLFELLLIGIVSLVCSIIGYALIELLLLIVLVFYKINTGHNSLPVAVHVISLIFLALLLISASMIIVQTLKAKVLKHPLFRSESNKRDFLFNLAKITLINIPISETIIKAATKTNDFLWLQSATLMPVCIILIVIVAYQTLNLKISK